MWHTAYRCYETADLFPVLTDNPTDLTTPAASADEDQTSFSELGYAGKKKRARRDRFLADVEAVMPRRELEAAIETHHPKGDGRGRPSKGVERMLRMYITQQCFAHVVKNLFRHRKTRHRGLDKNSKQFLTLFGLANLVLARKWLLAPNRHVAPAAG